MRYFNFSNSKIFLICCIIFIVGITGASFFSTKFMLHTFWWFAGIAGSAAAIILFWNNRVLRIIALWTLFLFLSFWRFAVGINVVEENKIWLYNGRMKTLTAQMINEPVVGEKSLKYTVETQTVANQKNISGKILITADLYPRYSYGDELEITCELQEPEPFNGFNYDRYLARFDIYSVCYYPVIRPVCRSEEKNNKKRTDSSDCLIKNSGAWFYKKIFILKNKFREVIDYGLPKPESDLARAIVIGDKKGIPDDLREKFSQTGVSHIMAISGMHISILAGMVMTMLLGIGFWRRHAFYFAAAFLIIYVILIGMPASAMRASLMGFLVLWALNIGRLNKITNSLFLSAAILLFINPRLLRDDIGFQLSFLAVFGIVYAYPLIDRLFQKFKIPKLKGIRDIFNITLAAQVFTIPIIALNFSLFSAIAPVANIMIIWTLPFLMIFIITAIFLSLLFKPLAFIFFLPAKIILSYIAWAAGFLAEVPFVYFEVESFWMGWCAIYYIIVIIILIKYKKSS